MGIFDTSIVTYDGGIIHGKVDIYMEGALLITTSGNTDWTIGGVPAVYWPLSNTFLMERGKEHIISGTMETPGVVRTFRAQDYTDGFGLVGIVIMPV